MIEHSGKIISFCNSLSVFEGLLNREAFDVFVKFRVSLLDYVHHLGHLIYAACVDELVYELVASDYISYLGRLSLTFDKLTNDRVLIELVLFDRGFHQLSDVIRCDVRLLEQTHKLVDRDISVKQASV